MLVFQLSIHHSFSFTKCRSVKILETHAYLSYHYITSHIFQPSGDSTSSEPILSTVPSRRQDGQHTSGLRAVSIKDTVQTAAGGNIPYI